MRLIDATMLYGKLLTYKDENGTPRRISDYDCDNFPNRLDIRTVRKAIIKSPTIDAVPVVRCKDCKNFDSRNWYCYYWDYEPGSSPNRVDDDDFCSYGERKDDAK